MEDGSWIDRISFLILIGDFALSGVLITQDSGLPSTENSRSLPPPPTVRSISELANLIRVSPVPQLSSGSGRSCY